MITAKPQRNRWCNITCLLSVNPDRQRKLQVPKTTSNRFHGTKILAYMLKISCFFHHNLVNIKYEHTFMSIYVCYIYTHKIVMHDVYNIYLIYLSFLIPRNLIIRKLISLNIITLIKLLLCSEVIFLCLYEDGQSISLKSASVGRRK